MDNSWVVDNLQKAFSTWNDRMEELWGLLTQSPETFKDGAIWNAMVGINGTLQAIGYGLLVLFFAINLFAAQPASGFPATGICAAAAHSVCPGQNRNYLRPGISDKNFCDLQWNRRFRSGQYWRC